MVSSHDENGAHLDVDEGILAAVNLESVERLVDQVTHVLSLLLAVVDSVPEVHCTKGIERFSHKTRESSTVLYLQEDLLIEDDDIIDWG